MVENLCTNYGDKICTVEGVDHYSFPSIDRLQSQEGVEQKLRSLGFGYRSPSAFLATAWLGHSFIEGWLLFPSMFPGQVVEAELHSVGGRRCIFKENIYQNLYDQTTEPRCMD